MPRRLNVMQVIPTLDRSGAEKQMTLLATRLDRARFNVYVCALTRGGPYEEPIRRDGLPLAVLGKASKLDLFLPGRLRAVMDRWRIDVAHTWLFAANCYGRVAARRAGVPVVVASERCVDRLKSRWQLAIDRRLARHTDVVLGNSRGVAAFYAKVGIDPAKLRVIPNGIEPGEPPHVDVGGIRRELGIPASALVCGVVGRLWRQKRVERVVLAVGLLQQADVEAHLVVVGDGPERADLERLGDELAKPGTVHFLGHRDDGPALMRVFDVLLLASDFEGMPNVVMEAMQASRPVVATAIPGTRDLVVDGRTGRLVPRKGAARAMAAALLELSQDVGLRGRLGEAGRRRLQERFSVDGMVRAHEALYVELARAKGIDV